MPASSRFLPALSRSLLVAEKLTSDQQVALYRQIKQFNQSMHDLRFLAHAALLVKDTLAEQQVRIEQLEATVARLEQRLAESPR